MKRYLGLAAAISAVIFLALVGCQTAKPVASTAAQSAIETESAGFSPNAANGAKTIEFSLLFADPESVKTWKVEIAGDEGVERTYSGDGANLPESIIWDGKTDSAVLAPEGAYKATLSIGYGKKLAAATATSSGFVLDVTPPEGSVTLNPNVFTPDSQGAVGSMTITVEAKSAVAKIDSGTLDFMDDSGKLIKSFDVKWPDNQAVWDGMDLSGNSVQPGKTYAGTFMIRDEFGNVGKSDTMSAVAELPTPPQQAQVPAPAPMPVSVSAGPSSITASETGFSPQGPNSAMKLSLVFAEPSSVSSWKMEISGDGGTAKSYRGDGTNLPQTLSWDGKTDAGSMAVEGTYNACLRIDYGSAFTANSVSSDPFVLDLTPPTGTIALSTPLFAPNEPGDTLTISLTASFPIATINNWSMDIYDPGGNLFKSFDGKCPDNQVVWDGKGIKGDMVVSSEDYPVSLLIHDEFGNSGTVKGNIPIDILVLKTDQGYRIPNSRIFFKPYTADYKDVPLDIAKQNAVRLNRLAEMLKKFPDYTYSIVGHAVMIYWNNPALGKIEQQKERIPLSQARSDAIKQALIERGINGDQIVTSGVGAVQQIVPNSDLANRWQNRRTAIYIVKK